ncbi:hypothetical protein QFC19_007732 [Naganishia cerealis]|uniref:Uncharacterized protein n=1 Tax=Naganishia cerealis TaxID=610337 RepID=A0ACC2V7W0_9TREE|nr:hypothetical protein QFC19_007732 [Naganishia cerealis]
MSAVSLSSAVPTVTSEKAENVHNEKKQYEQDVAIPTLGRVNEAGSTTVFPVITTYKAIILVTLVMVSAMMQVASGIGVSITIADIGHDLKIPSGQLQWVASAGSLATACTLLVSGKLADMYGHKPVFVIGCTLGGAMFLGMGLAQNKYQLFRSQVKLIYDRVTPAAIGLIGTTFPEGPAKSRAFAGLGAGAPVGTAIGLVLAGEGGNAPQGWKTPFVWIILGGGIVVSALFVLWERRLEKRGTKQPLMRINTVHYDYSMLFISRTSSQSEQGQGGSIFSAVVAIGGALMLAISTIVSDRVAQQKAASLGIIIEASKTQSADIPKFALLQGYRAAFWTCFGLSMLAALIVGVLLRKMGTVGGKKQVVPVKKEEQTTDVGIA